MERLRFPTHGLVIDEDRFRSLLRGSVSLMAVEKKRIFEYVPKMTQEQLDAVISILESEKEKIDAVSSRGEKIRRLIETLRIIAALDWAEIEYGLSPKNP